MENSLCVVLKILLMYLLYKIILHIQICEKMLNVKI
jgi:hypothetical protein